MRKILLVFFLIFSAVATAVVLWSVYNSGQLKRLMVEQVGKRITKSEEKTDLLKSALGFDRPRVYLFLFLNNTELRPAGGFIGSYAVVRMSGGAPELLKVEGTEILDNLAPKFASVPPEPLRTYLGVDKWSFRDSNWNPDFSLSAEKALELYKKENGLEAENIDAVIGFTPTVIEEVLRVSGPVKVNGEEFNADNFTEKLEYEVEYGFSDRGLKFSDRKKMLADLAAAILSRAKSDVLKNSWAYWSLAAGLLKEKQIVAYAEDASWEKFLRDSDWAGEMKKNDGDYILWVDANLGALKTDVVMERSLNFSVTTTNDGYLARAAMRYDHQGKMNWRISRYRTYSRVYVPLGCKLVKVEGKIKNAAGVDGAYDEGEENGRQWFGAFISVEPGKSGELAFIYKLSPTVTEDAILGKYDLLAQKQIGTLAPKLTLDLDFGKKFISAEPAEKEEKTGDNKYYFFTDLKEDKSFRLEFVR